MKMIKINGAEYRNLPQQVAKNANDIEALKEARTLVQYYFDEEPDVDPNIPMEFTGTVVTINGFLVSAIGFINVQDNTQEQIVKFEKAESNNIKLYSKDSVIEIDLTDADTQDSHVIY
jgi:hypothetical protein